MGGLSCWERLRLPEPQGKAQCNLIYPPFPSPGQVPTGGGRRARPATGSAGRLRRATPRPRSRGGSLKKFRFRLVLSCGRSQLFQDRRRRRFSFPSFAFSSSSLSRSVTSSACSRTRRGARRYALGGDDRDRDREPRSRAPSTGTGTRRSGSRRRRSGSRSRSRLWSSPPRA